MIYNYTIHKQTEVVFQLKMQITVVEVNKCKIQATNRKQRRFAAKPAGCIHVQILNL